MERKSKKITAFLLAFLMILSVCLPSAGSLGLNRVNAEADSGYEESTGMDLSNATSTDASTEAAQATTEAEYITTGDALTGMPAPIANENTPMPTAAGDDGLTVKNFKVKVNGKELQDGDVVTNGAPVEVTFDWSIQNNSHVKDFDVDLSVENFTINDYAESDLKDNSGKVVGKWWIQDGKIYFHLNDEFVDESEIDGGARLEGNVAAEKVGDDARQEKDFKIGDSSYKVNVDFNNESWLNVQKSADGSAYIDENNNKLYQKFKLNFDTNWSGKVTLGDVTDQAQGFMDDSVRNLTVQFPDGTTSNYSNWSELQSALNGQELDTQQNIVVTYEMAVEDMKDAMLQTPTKELDNTVNATYKDNKNQEKSAKSTASPKIPRPSVQKSGTVSEPDTNGDIYVEWTITIDPGVFSGDDIQTVVDTLDANLSLEDSSIDLNNLKNNLTKNSDGTYSYTYKTKVNDEVLGSPLQKEVSNDVTVTFEVDDNKYEYSDEALVGIQPDDILDKEAVGYDAKEKLIKWKIKLHIPEDGSMTNVKLLETPDYQQSLDLNIKVDGTLVISNGVSVNNTIISSVSMDWEKAFTFTDTYIASKAGQDITIEVETKPNDNVLDSYQKSTLTNTVRLEFTYDGTNGSQQDSATYEFIPPENVLTKNGTVSKNDRNTIDYTLDVNLTVMELVSGNVITVEDILPEHMHILGMPEYKSYKVYGGWDAESEWKDTDITYTADGRNITFSLTVNDDLLNAIKDGSLNSYHLLIKYSAQVDHDYLEEMLASGTEKYFKNTAEVFLDDSLLDSAEIETPLKYGNLTNKNGSYPDNSDAISYTIIVNPDALDLVKDSEYLTGVDTSGKALILKNGTVKVYQYTGTGNPETDDSNWVLCTNARYTYDQEKRTIRFTLPDSTALKITYDMLVNLYVDGETPENSDNLTMDNSTNSFSLYGTSGKDSLSSKGWSQRVQVPNVWSNAVTGTITIYKFWTDNGQMVALDGSKFELYKCEWTSEGITDSKKELMQTFSINANGETTVSDLPFDNIYALYEVEAKDGFVCNDEPYYFALVSKNSQEVQNTFPNNVELYFSTAYIYYENEPAQAKLVLKKTIAGDTSVDDLEALENAALDITFTVKDSDDQVVGEPHKLSEFKKNSGGYELELDVAPGTYTVEETKTTITGYKLESTSYTITTQSTGSTAVTTDTETSAKTGDITIKDGDTVTAAFTNTYSKEETTGTLVLKKTIKGSVTKDEAEGALKFTVESKDGTFSETYTLDEDFIYDETTKEYTLTLDNLSAGEYTVTESVTDITGHVLESVTYSVDGETAVSGKEASAEVTAGGSIEVAFEDDYRNAVGTLVIEKTISGELTSDELDAVKDSIVFTVTDPSDNTKEYTLDKFTYDTSAKKYTLKLENQALGTYTVTETAKDITGKVLQTTYSVDSSTFEAGKKAETELEKDGSESTVAFQNKYIDEENAGKLIIQKKIEGSVTDEEAKGALQFTVESKDGTFSETYTLDKDFDYNSETGIFTKELDVVAGEYTVTESVRDVDGHVLKSVSYTVSGSSAETKTDPGSVGVTVQKKGEVTVTFKDDYEKATGKLVLKKTIKGSVTKEEAEGALTFTVTDETGKSTDYTLKNFKYDEKTGEYTLELTEEVGEYTVTESVKDIEGHILQSVTYTLNNGTETNGDSVKAEVKQDKTTTVVFKDDYIEEDKTGTLVLKKTIKGAITKEEAEGALEFTVKNNTTKEEKTYTLKDFKYDEKTGEYTLTLPLEEGGYTVTESTKDVDGYVLDSVTYSVNGGAVTKGDSVTTDVKAKETVTVAFEDDYSKSKTESSSEQITETTTEITTETTTETTIITTENVTETETQTSARSEVKTGDKAPIVLVCILLLVSAAAGGIVIGKKMKNKKDQ